MSERKSLSAVVSLQWHEKYSAIGTFTIVAGATDQNAKILRKNRIIYYQGYTGIIQQVKYDAGQITANGSALSVLLNQRVLLNDTEFNIVESSLYAAWTANSRGMDVVAADEKGLTETYQTVTVGNSIGDLATEICSTVGLGFRVRLDLGNGQKVFEIYKGDDLTGANDPKAVVFSTAKNTLGSLEIDDDGSQLCNVAIVRSNDQDDHRIMEIVGTASGSSRIELGVDATGLKMEPERPIYDDDGNEIGTTPAETLDEFRARLRAAGVEALQERIERISFTASVSPTDYGKRFKLGDIVSCYSAQYGLKINARISEVTYTVDRTKSTIELTLGDPKLTAKELVRIWRR